MSFPLGRGPDDLGFFRGVGWGLVFALVLWAGAIAGGVLLGWLAWQAVR